MMQVVSAGVLLLLGSVAAGGPPGYVAYPGRYCSADGGTRLFQKPAVEVEA